MENKQKILKLGEIDIVEYLNKTHPVSDSFLVESEREELKKCQEELNSYLHLAFIENCVPLLEILNTYKSCYSLLESIEPPNLFQRVSEPNLNDAESKEFEKACQSFVDDMSPFFVGSRYLVRAEAFGKYYCVLTNDLLFMGIKTGDDKYLLKNSLSRAILVVSKEEERLVIKTNTGISYELTGNKDVVGDFYDLLCENTRETFDSKGCQEIDSFLVDYYIETCQHETLEAYISEHNASGEIVLGTARRLQIATIDDLCCAMRIFGDSSSIFKEFMLERFLIGLHKVNKIQRTEGFIKATFDYLEGFFEEMDSVSVKSGVKKHSQLLCMELLILRTFDFIEKRVFNKFCEISPNTAILEQIKSRLNFQGLDFTYLMRALLGRRDAFETGCVESAKKEIIRGLEGL
ncbi:hypothetical protein PAEPH01_0717 [Pancytospora epiphaga]|nr:hypothetical protein PAEPH01_0717 [Pancytospora epiphaga]